MKILDNKVVHMSEANMTEEEDQEVKKLKAQAPAISMYKHLGVVQDGYKNNKVGWLGACFFIMILSVIATIAVLALTPSPEEYIVLANCQDSIAFYDDLILEYQALDQSIEETELSVL